MSLSFRTHTPGLRSSMAPGIDFVSARVRSYQAAHTYWGPIADQLWLS